MPETKPTIDETIDLRIPGNKIILNGYAYVVEYTVRNRKLYSVWRPDRTPHLQGRFTKKENVQDVAYQINASLGITVVTVRFIRSDGSSIVLEQPRPPYQEKHL